MANLTRSAKSGNQWTQHDLEAYNIKVVYRDASTFFGAPLPQPAIRPEVLTTQNMTDAAHDHYLLVFLHFVRQAASDSQDEEFPIVDFVWDFFQLIEYERPYSLVRTRTNFQFPNCGRVKRVKTDVCIVDDTSERVLLLVEGDKRRLPHKSDAEPRLIAQAIAAFSANNSFRVQTLGQPALEEETIPGIVMKGTMPTFYKIPVTTALVRAVERGRYPPQETVVYAHLPELPRPQQCFSEGMEPLDNRRIIFACFDAFRQFIQ